MKNQDTVISVTPKELRPKSNGKFINIEMYFKDLINPSNHDCTGGIQSNGD